MSFEKFPANDLEKEPTLEKEAIIDFLTTEGFLEEGRYYEISREQRNEAGELEILDIQVIEEDGTTTEYTFTQAKVLNEDPTREHGERNKGKRTSTEASIVSANYKDITNVTTYIIGENIATHKGGSWEFGKGVKSKKKQD